MAVERSAASGHLFSSLVGGQQHEDFLMDTRELSPAQVGSLQSESLTLSVGMPLRCAALQVGACHRGVACSQQPVCRSAAATSLRRPDSCPPAWQEDRLRLRG